MTRAGDQGDQSAPREHRVWLLVLALAAAAALAAVPTVLADPSAVRLSLVGLALIPLFGLAEVVVIHLPTQRNAHGHTLREVPAVVGLTFLAPQEYLLVYVAGTVSALFLVTRMRGVKLAFNTALFAFEAGLGAAVYHLILSGGDPIAPWGWLAALTAVVATDLISAAAITTAISVTEGAFDGEVLRETLRSGLAAACINTCVALLVATLLIVRPTSLPLLAVVVVLLVMGYRVYTALARGHARTQLLYRFVDHTATAQALDDVVRVVLGEAADLMHAERSYLLEVDEPEVPVGGAGSSSTGPRRLRCRTLGPGSTVLTTTLTLPTTAGPGAAGETAWWQPALDGQPLLLPSGREEPEGERARTVSRPGRSPRPRRAACRPCRCGRATPWRRPCGGATEFVPCSWCATGPSTARPSARTTSRSSGPWPPTPRWPSNAPTRCPAWSAWWSSGPTTPCTTPCRGCRTGEPSTRP